MDTDKIEHEDEPPLEQSEFVNPNRVKRHASFVDGVGKDELIKLLVIVQTQRDRICPDKPSAIGDVNELRCKTVEYLRNLYANESSRPF